MRGNKAETTKKKFGRVVVYFISIISTFLLVAFVTLFIILKMFCSPVFPNVQETFVTTVLETGQLKFLASIFLTPEEIQKIVDKNSMKEFNVTVDVNLIQQEEKRENEEAVQAEIEIVEVAGTTYTGTMMIVKDPSRISLATIYPWREEGVTLDQLVTSNDGIAGINGGLYDSTNNTGGRPYGVIVSNGEIQHNKPKEYPGLVLVGFTDENILQIIDVSDKTETDVVKLVEEMGIRDAVTFQEESSDKNNHFVQLVINGQSRQMNGMGSGLNPRTAIGQRADGSVLLFVTDGRGKSGHLGASCADLIRVMEDFDAVNAANLDGGSSSCMYYEDRYLMSSVTFYYDNSSWKLPAGFIVK